MFTMDVKQQYNNNNHFSVCLLFFSGCQYYKYLSCVYGVDRKICHKGHSLASRGLPRDAEQ